MKSLILAVFCVGLTCATTSNDFSFNDLQEQEVLSMHNDVMELCKTLQVAQEQLEVLLNYLCIAARSARIEQTFVTLYAVFQHDLMRIKNAQLLSDKDRASLACQFNLLNQRAGIKSEHAQILGHIEAYIDEHEEYGSFINLIRQPLTDILTKSLEYRAMLIDELLLRAESKLNDDVLPVIGRFCKGLALEPELLIDDAFLALNRVDVMSNLSQQLSDKIVAASEIKGAMEQAVYFTLLVTFYYFKELYAVLYTHYVDAYGSEPRLLFGPQGLLPVGTCYFLPKELLDKTR